METKFRGQRVDNSEMVYGYYRKNSFYNNLGDEPKLIYTKHFIGSFDNLTCFDRIFEQVEVIPKTVGQFTGLKDKNGVEVYSDDFLTDGKNTFRIYQVAGGFAIKAYPWCNNTTDLELTDEFILMPCAQTRSWIENSCEVIGNIHANPELLTKKEPD